MKPGFSQLINMMIEAQSRYTDSIGKAFRTKHYSTMAQAKADAIAECIRMAEIIGKE